MYHLARWWAMGKAGWVGVNPNCLPFTVYPSPFTSNRYNVKVISFWLSAIPRQGCCRARAGIIAEDGAPHASRNEVSRLVFHPPAPHEGAMQPPSPPYRGRKDERLTPSKRYFSPFLTAPWRCRIFALWMCGGRVWESVSLTYWYNYAGVDKNWVQICKA